MDLAITKKSLTIREKRPIKSQMTERLKPTELQKKINLSAPEQQPRTLKKIMLSNN